MSKNLLDSSSSDEEEDSKEFKVNEQFANVFNKYREKEEYQKLKAKYGEEAAKSKLGQDDDDDEVSSSESSSEEDEDAHEWTEEHEKDFFKTLANLKRKDSKLYDGKTAFFRKIEASKLPSKKEDDKPMTLGDLEREVIMKKEGEFDELADEKLAEKLKDKTYVQEMEEIQSKLKKATADSDESDDGDDLLLAKKSKTEEQVKREEADYREWLAGHKDHLKDEEAEKELKTLKDYWTDKNLDEGEKFLRDYILNKRYIEHDSSDEERMQDEEALSDDEKTLEKQAEFEHKYNFRFEEPDAEFIKRYPRTIQDSMRRKDESRKKKRLEIKDRKLREKELKREELKQLKAHKRKEILEKIEKLRKITGNEELAFKDEDLEEDFDPEKYDQRMNELFDQYDKEPIGPEDEEKPVFSDLEDSDLEVENWDEYGEDDDEVAEVDDERRQAENDAQESPADDGNKSSKAELQSELIEASKGRKKSKKRKSKFAEKLEASKPLFDPEDKSFEQYIDEYYGLDYEDIIGDLPCRFKYRKVPANDLGLSVEEILSAPDRELNAWASLKKTCQYRSEEEEKRDLLEYKKKGSNVSLKKKILPSLFKEDPEEELQAEQDQKASKSKKRRRRKGKSGNGAACLVGDLDAEAPLAKKAKVEAPNDLADESKSKKKRKKRKEKLQKKAVNVDVLKNVSTSSTHAIKGKSKKKNAVNADLAISDTRMEHYGLKPSQFKRQVRKRKYREMSGKA